MKEGKQERKEGRREGKQERKEGRREGKQERKEGRKERREAGKEGRNEGRKEGTVWASCRDNVKSIFQGGAKANSKWIGWTCF